MVDALANFAYVTVPTAPSPPTSVTTLTLESGEGSTFPAEPFDLLFWPPGVQPLRSNAELARCTHVAGDVLTFTRAQYGTSAQPVAVGYQVSQPIDANLLGQLAGVPIGDPGQVGTDIAYSDPISNNAIQVLTLNEETNAIAIGRTGDAFPMMVFRPAGNFTLDSGSAVLAIGDGTFDPANPDVSSDNCFAITPSPGTPSGLNLGGYTITAPEQFH